VCVSAVGGSECVFEIEMNDDQSICVFVRSGSDGQISAMYSIFVWFLTFHFGNWFIVVLFVVIKQCVGFVECPVTV